MNKVKIRKKKIKQIYVKLEKKVANFPSVDFCIFWEFGIFFFFVKERFELVTSKLDAKLQIITLNFEAKFELIS